MRVSRTEASAFLQAPGRAFRQSRLAGNQFCPQPSLYPSRSRRNTTNGYHGLPDPGGNVRVDYDVRGHWHRKTENERRENSTPCSGAVKWSSIPRKNLWGVMLLGE